MSKCWPTDAKFNVGQQISDLEQMIARKPNVIFSFRSTQSRRPKLIRRRGRRHQARLPRQCPGRHGPGKDYVSVVAADNEKNAFFAADELQRRSGARARSASSRSSTTIITRSRPESRGAEGLRAISGHQGRGSWHIHLAREGLRGGDEHAHRSSGHERNVRRLGYPGAAGGRRRQDVGRNLIITTNDLAADSAVNVARGEFLAVGAQQPYDQGVAEAKVAALALLGKETPPYVSVPTLRVKKIDLLARSSRSPRKIRPRR